MDIFNEWANCKGFVSSKPNTIYSTEEFLGSSSLINSMVKGYKKMIWD